MNIPKNTENEKLGKLFLAIYFNDIEEVIEFKNQKADLYAKKHNFFIEENRYAKNENFQGITFDLTNLTLLNYKIWFTDGWRKERMPFINEKRQQTNNMVDFWKSEGEDVLNRKIEYNKYFEYFYSNDPNNPESDKEIIADPTSYFLEKGFREIDLRLYNRAECFDFVETENLLEKGANPNVHFYEDEDSSIFDRINTERSYLTTCEVTSGFDFFKRQGYQQYFHIPSMFGDLLGLAAHEEMYALLSKYDKEK